MHPSLASAEHGLRHVFLRDMLVGATIGVHAHEHGRPQRVRINIDLAVTDPDTGPNTGPDTGIGRDDLRRVVDYEALAASVRAIVAAGHVKLVETLAERIAASCLTDPRVQIARIAIEKLDVFTDISSAGVVIERSRR